MSKTAPRNIVLACMAISLVRCSDVDAKRTHHSSLITHHSTHHSLLRVCSDPHNLPFLPFVFDISMGVRRGDTKLRERLDNEIERRQPDIDRILDSYGVPRV